MRQKIEKLIETYGYACVDIDWNNSSDEQLEEMIMYKAGAFAELMDAIDDLLEE